MGELEHFGRNLKQARLKSGMTQDQLGKLLNCDGHYIHNMELGLIDPSLVEMEVVAIALEIKLALLIDGIISYQPFMGRYRR